MTKLIEREWCIRATRYSRITPTYTSASDFSQNVTATTERKARAAFRKLNPGRDVSINSCRAYTSAPFDVVHLFDDGTGAVRAE